MLAPIVNPATQTYINQNGNILNGNPLLTLILSRLTIPLGGWMNNRTLGSELFNFVTQKQSVSQVKISNTVKAALQDLVQQGLIKNLLVQVTLISIGNFSIGINCVDNQGQPIEFSWSPLS